VRCLPGIVVLSLFTAGCGSSDPYTYAPVSGRVTLNSKPLVGAPVSFQPVAAGTSTPGIGSAAITDADGRFTLEVVGKKIKGAVVGMHKVRIDLPREPETDPTDDRPKKIKHLPAKYSGKDTKLEFDVPAGGSDAANFNLTTSP
jgi:hypothetical protein